MIEYQCPHCRTEYYIGFEDLKDMEITKGEGTGVCCACGGWLIFEADWSTRRFEPEDLLDTDDELLCLMRRATEAAHGRVSKTQSLGDALREVGVSVSPDLPRQRH